MDTATATTTATASSTTATAASISTTTATTTTVAPPAPTAPQHTATTLPLLLEGTPPSTTSTTAATTAARTAAPSSTTTRSTNSSRVRVAVRLRPLLAREHGEQETTSAVPTAKSINVHNSHSFAFDHVYPPQSTQQEIYQEAVSPMVEEVIAGYNVTIMAYGQTGSGKTFTMGTTGTEDEEENEEHHHRSNPDEVGITPRSINELYARLESTGLDFEVSCSVLELYKDELRDLQRGDEVYCARGQQLRLQEINGSIAVKNLVEITCRQPEHVMECLRLASCNRVVGSTEMNAESSRSHMVCRLTVQQFPPNTDNGEGGGAAAAAVAAKAAGVNGAGSAAVKSTATPAVTSQLTFVDLAGSERLKKTMATGNRKKEGIAINKGVWRWCLVAVGERKLYSPLFLFFFLLLLLWPGLFHLGRVINANALGKNDPHIYRASKLTRLLQDALGGNSKTLFIACVSPADSSSDETLSTLR